MEASQLKKALEKAEEEALKKERLAIARNEALKRQAEQEATRISDSISKANAAHIKRLESEHALALQEAEKQKALNNQADAIKQAVELEANRIRDSIAQVNAVKERDSNRIAENQNSERMQFRNNCHYLLDEYDDFTKKICHIS